MRSFELEQRVSRRLRAIAELAPGGPSLSASSGLKLALLLGTGRRSNDAAGRVQGGWERVRAMRRGPGADGFVLWPLPPPGEIVFDGLMERCLELRALVDVIREHRHRHPSQALDCYLRRRGMTLSRRAVHGDLCPVMIRLGAWFVTLEVGDEHPRRLRDKILEEFRLRPRSLSFLRRRRIPCIAAISLRPLPLVESVHLHRWGIEGPWIGFSRSGTWRAPRFAVISAHHLVLEGPALACLRVDFQRRLRALRVGLGMDVGGADWLDSENFSAFDAAPFELSPLEESVFTDRVGRLKFSHGSQQAALDGADDVENLPAALRALLLQSAGHWLDGEPWRERRLKSPSLRFATIERGSFSLSRVCYAFCCAQHQALRAADSSYKGRGFTFIVPRMMGAAPFSSSARSRGRPVLCSLQVKGGEPEGVSAFTKRLKLRLEEAERGEDLLSELVEDLFHADRSDLLGSALVSLYERLPVSGGSFLRGRGMVSYARVPDEDVDPVASHAGIYEGLFAGSCQVRDGVTLSIIDRGYRRDLCAVGSGVLSDEVVMERFWSDFSARYSANCA